tara:strand:- start:1749 stop:4304 length:2556 start_codon:yes stop_codon:yes gene_type:complete
MSASSNLYNYFITLFTSFLLPILCFSNHINGVISDKHGEPLPFASIYIKNTTYGVSSNAFGEYFIELKPGNYTIVYSYIGFKSEEKLIILQDIPQKINIILYENDQNLIEYEVVSNTKNKALEIIDKVKKVKNDYVRKSYSSKEYSKNTIEKRQFKLQRKDTIEVWQLDTSKTINLKNDVLKFVESYGDFYSIEPNKKNWSFKAYQDFADTKQEQDFVIIQSFEDFGNYNITPEYEVEDKYEFLITLSEIEFDLFKNNIPIQIANKPIVSPLSPGSRTYYKYDYLGFFPQKDSTKIHKIQITPRFKNELLLEGVLFIEDSTFLIKSVELELSGPIQSEFNIENFHIIQNYQQFESQNVIDRKIIDYTIKEEIFKIIGNAVVINSNFNLSEKKPDYFKKNQVKFFSDSANLISNEQWDGFRAIDLKKNEVDYIQYTDSLRDYYQSEQYALEQDSNYNKISLAKLLWQGIGHKNRYKGYSFYIWPVVSQFNFFGIGGYRHNLGFNYNKNISDKFKISTENNIDYGIVNKDFKGSTKISIISNNEKYKQLTIGIGDDYKPINRFPSISTAFSRSNYVRKQHVQTAYRTELLNGLYGEMKLEYCLQTPIDNLDLESDIFSSTDSILGLTPLGFEPYRKFESRIQLTWLPFQKFYYKKNKKVVLGTKFPTVNLIYRKGVPKIFQSEVNFDYLELGVNDEFTIPHLGKSKWNIQMGAFVNKKNLRVIEWKYFRGSDRGFFSNPLSSFQLLGTTLFSESSYLRGNYVHSFDGNIFNKLPLIGKLGLQLSGGIATLIIPDQDFAHLESFIGISRQFRVFGGLVKFGVFLSSSINSTNKSKFELKVGANGYNSFNNQWDY